MNITQEFSSILSLPVIATHVSVKLVMHNGLFIRDEQEQVAEKHSFVSREVGNVTVITPIPFFYSPPPPLCFLLLWNINFAFFVYI